MVFLNYNVSFIDILINEPFIKQYYMIMSMLTGVCMYMYCMKNQPIIKYNSEYFTKSIANLLLMTCYWMLYIQLYLKLNYAKPWFFLKSCILIQFMISSFIRNFNIYLYMCSKINSYLLKNAINVQIHGNMCLVLFILWIIEYVVF